MLDAECISRQSAIAVKLLVRSALIVIVLETALVHLVQECHVCDLKQQMQRKDSSKWKDTMNERSAYFIQLTCTTLQQPKKFIHRTKREAIQLLFVP